MSSTDIKVGDMVVLIALNLDSSAYELGLRVGHIGTVECFVDLGSYPRERFFADVFVRFPVGRVGCPLSDLRRIIPPGEERGSWDYGWYTPPHLRVFKKEVA